MVQGVSASRLNGNEADDFIRFALGILSSNPRSSSLTLSSVRLHRVALCVADGAEGVGHHQGGGRGASAGGA